MLCLSSIFQPGAGLPFLRLTLGSMVAAAEPAGNRLAREKSPYLQQHADNPVDWFPWGEAAFAAARRENLLIFLSIGYSTCHWCHVMERESFSDPELAAMLNRDYIAIKVDREERPDIDRFYLQVCTALTGSGGWPLTILMTPDQTPLFAATYLPKARHGERPGMLDLLPRVAALWRDNPAALRRGGAALIDELQQRAGGAQPPGAFSADLAERAAATLRAGFDEVHGGFGSAPKFPRCHDLGFLLHHARRNRDAGLLQLVELTLQKLRQGGIYDQLGFGIHRYATDRQWLVPHFEKMLYDQAGLARLCLEAWQLTAKRDYAATAEELFSYVLRQLRDPLGGFYSAEDADSEGVEGRFYVWRKREIIELLGAKRGERFARIYQVTDSGNYAAEAPDEPCGENILHLRQSLTDWAVQLATPLHSLRKELEEDRRRLFAQRQLRVHPFRDDKVLTAWNGLMISPLALGGRLLDRPAYLQAAAAAADFILAHLRDDRGGLLRRWRQGEAAIPAFADDYAFFTQGLLDLYRGSFDPRRLQQAVALAEQLQRRFSDAQGRIYDTGADHELPVRTSELHDDATPSAAGVALNVYAQLFRLTGQSVWRERAQALLDSAAADIARYPAGYTQLLLGAGRLLEAGRELVIVGAPDAADTRALLRTVRYRYQPELSVLLRPVGATAAIDRLAPFAAAMRPLDGRATAYLCRSFSCQKPLTDPEQLSALLGQPPD